MEQLQSVFQAVCIGGCICGAGIAVVLAGFLVVTGRGILTVIQDVLGIGHRDTEKMLDETQDALQRNRQILQTKREQFVGSDGLPDFDAAVAKYSQQGDNSVGNFSAQSAPPPSQLPPQQQGGLRPNMPRLGGAKRFEDNKSGSLRPRKNEDDNDEIYDDGDFFDG